MTSTMNIGLPVVAMARWMDTVALEPLVVVTMCVVVLIVVWVSVKARKSPNDPKLSDRGGWRECCAVGLLGAALVTAVAVRCSAWLGDVGSVGIWRLVLEIAALLLGCIVFAVWAAGIEMMRAVKRADRDRRRDAGNEERQPSNYRTTLEFTQPRTSFQFEFGGGAAIRGAVTSIDLKPEMFVLDAGVIHLAVGKEHPSQESIMETRTCFHMGGAEKARAQSPNDPKLSDGGGLAADVPVGSAGLPHSGCQTGAVRCSAWLGCGYWSFTVTIPSVTNFGMTRHEYPLEKVPTYIWLPVAQEVLRLAGRSEEKQRQLMYDLAAQVAPAQRTHEG